MITLFVIYVDGKSEETVMYDEIADIERHIQEHYIECGVTNVTYKKIKESN